MYNSDVPTRAELPTTKQLIRSTLLALAAAAAILVTVVLPSEYAVDPTGFGRVLGLTQMGEIKQQLAEEAEMDAAASAGAQSAIPLQTADMDASGVPAAGEGSENAASPSEPDLQAADWKDEVVLTLAPGEAAEIKLTMKAGETAQYEWAVQSGNLNSDLHGDGKGGQATSYRKGRAEAGNAGELTAAFDGAHGWFWRNRGDADVQLTLRVRGAYTEVKRVI